MLTSLTVHLFPIKDSVLPPTMGHYIHAVFLKILHQTDPQTARQIHTNSRYKPFTVSPLQGNFIKLKKDKLLIPEDTNCWIRFTIMEDEITSAIVRFFLESDSSLIRLGNDLFQVTKISTHSGINGQWNACATFREILDYASDDFNMLRMRFYSPTAFKTTSKSNGKSRNHVFPDQVYCFQSWVRKWNHFSPITIDEKAVLGFVKKNIRSTRYSIETKIMDFGRYKQMGFVGECEYKLIRKKSGSWSEKQNRLLKQVSALADFAFYCGTGYKTTMGMGQTRREVSDEIRHVSKDFLSRN
ncbi:CRISPR-associated endoribonuclease Cas6 [Candidatus Poribacteria bacterium]|nr:CRISPR-associated endoribonuclease Cas6 [Candidatus Poribacteria bacterium]